MSNRKADAAERKARLAALQAAQRKAERRRTTIIAAVVGVAVLALIAVTLFIVVGENRRNAALEEDAQGDIEGVETFEGLSANHVEGDVDYEQTPAVGGDHSGAWQNCGTYSEPVRDENAAHSLEHGAVWIAYDPSLPAEDVERLESYAASNNYVLVTPYEGLTTPVAASAWGVQLMLEDPSDERLSTFVRKYVRGDQTPESGAPCTGGIGTPQ